MPVFQLESGKKQFAKRTFAHNATYRTDCLRQKRLLVVADGSSTDCWEAMSNVIKVAAQICQVAKKLTVVCLKTESLDHEASIHNQNLIAPFPRSSYK